LLCIVFNISTVMILSKNLFNMCLLKANKKQKEQTLQWLGSCFKMEGSRPITRPSHQVWPILTDSHRTNCMTDPKVWSNQSTHQLNRSNQPVRAEFQNYVNYLYTKKKKITNYLFRKHPMNTIYSIFKIFKWCVRGRL